MSKFAKRYRIVHRPDSQDTEVLLLCLWSPQSHFLSSYRGKALISSRSLFLQALRRVCKSSGSSCGLSVTLSNPPTFVSQTQITVPLLPIPSYPNQQLRAIKHERNVTIHKKGRKAETDSISTATFLFNISRITKYKTKTDKTKQKKQLINKHIIHTKHT